MKKLLISFLFLNFLIAEEQAHLSIDKITKKFTINNNLSGLIELKNHNDTSSGFFALSKDYPVVLNTYKAPVASIIKQVRFYVYEKTGVGVLKMFYHNSDTIAIDSVSMNFSDLNTGGSANDILVKDRLWNLEKDESFFISYEVDWDNSSSDASLKYFLDKGDPDTTNTKYWPPRTHVWNNQKNKWSYLSNANNFIGSVGLSDDYIPEIYLSIRELGDNTPFNLYFTRKDSWTAIKMRQGGSDGGDLYYKYPFVSPSAELVVFSAQGVHVTDRWGRNEITFDGDGPFDWSGNSKFVYTFNQGNSVKIYDLNKNLVGSTGGWKHYAVSKDKTLIVLTTQDGGKSSIHLFRVNQDTGEMTKISELNDQFSYNDVAPIQGIDISPNNNELVYIHNAVVHKAMIKNDSLSYLGRMTNYGNGVRELKYSNDGNKIAYVHVNYTGLYQSRNEEKEYRLTTMDFDGRFKKEVYVTSAWNVNRPNNFDIIQSIQWNEDDSGVRFLLGQIRQSGYNYVNDLVEISAQKESARRGDLKFYSYVDKGQYSTSGVHSYSFAIKAIKFTNQSTISFNEDDSTTFKLELDGLDPGDIPVYTILEADSNISVSINDDEVSIRPNRDWNGAADFTIKAKAGSRTASKTFSIIVIPVNDPPQDFEWTSSASDTINISQSNTADAYTLSWSKSSDADEKDTGSSLSFDGIDDYAIAPSIELLNSVFTLEAWYKSDGVGDNGEINIVSNYGTGVSSAVSWNLMIQGSNDSSPGVARFFAAGGSGIDGTSRIDDNVWHHVAFVRYSDGSANLFVDGELENSGTVEMNYNIDSGNNLLIGSRHYNRFTDCKISELMISKTARYSSNFVPPNNLITDTNALIHYRFDEGAGNSLTDYSGNNNSGTINGASWDTDSPSSTIYVIHAKIGAYSSEDIVHTSETTYPILYEDILEGAFANVIGNAATVSFTVWAHDGIDSVQVKGEDRLLFVNRYDYLLTESEGIPDEFALHENYPNPFNPTTQIRFDLPEMSNVTLTIYNMIGQKIKSFNMKSTPAGYHSLAWNATNDFGIPVSAGVYLYQLETEGFIKTKKMVLLK